MNEKEFAELRRQFKADRHTISRVYGCYVNENNEIISSFEQPMGLLLEEETEQYMTLLKKVLSGGLGRNLLELEFKTRQVAEGEEHRFLMELRESKLKDEALRQKLYETIIPTMELDSNYVILLAYVPYDVPYRSKTDAIERDREADEQVFSYILCSICPVKRNKAGLSYDHSEKNFHMEQGEWLVSAPELGFLFPAFDNRSTNLYNAELYTKDIKNVHEAFVDALFRTELPKSAAAQKAGFEAVLSEALEDECSMEVMQAVHEQLTMMIAAHKESKVPEPLYIHRSEVEEVLEDCGISEEHLAKFNVAFDTEFGTDQPVAPRNIIDSKRFEVKTPDVTIHVSPECSDLVQTRVIDGVKYIVIRAEDGVEVNGVPVQSQATEPVNP